MRADDESRYRVGITTNTRGGWEKDVFLSFREAHEAGYRYVESFIDYFGAYLDKPDGAVCKKTDEIGVKFDTISNGGRMEMHFEDPSKHEKIIEQHMRLVRFIKRLGCDHLKINTGPRRPAGTTAQDLKNMAVVLNMLGKRISERGPEVRRARAHVDAIRKPPRDRHHHRRRPIRSTSGSSWIPGTSPWRASIRWNWPARSATASSSFT